MNLRNRLYFHRGITETTKQARDEIQMNRKGNRAFKRRILQGLWEFRQDSGWGGMKWELFIWKETRKGKRLRYKLSTNSVTVIQEIGIKQSRTKIIRDIAVINDIL